MKPGERLAWLLVVALTATATTLWWRGRDRYEFRAGSTGQVLWKFDRQTGRAWVAFSSSQVWKPVAEPHVDEFGGLLVNEFSNPYLEILKTNKADAFGRELEQSASQGWDFLLAQVRRQFPAYTNRTDDELIVGLSRNYPGILEANPALRGPLNEARARPPAAGKKAPPLNPSQQ